MIAASEGIKLDRLFERYGILGDGKDQLNVMNFLNIEKEGDIPADPKEQPVI